MAKPLRPRQICPTLVAPSRTHRNCVRKLAFGKHLNFILLKSIQLLVRSHERFGFWKMSQTTPLSGLHPGQWRMRFCEENHQQFPTWNREHVNHRGSSGVRRIPSPVSPGGAMSPFTEHMGFGSSFGIWAEAYLTKKIQSCFLFAPFWSMACMFLSLLFRKMIWEWNIQLSYIIQPIFPDASSMQTSK